MGVLLEEEAVEVLGVLRLGVPLDEEPAATGTGSDPRFFFKTFSIMFSWFLVSSAGARISSGMSYSFLAFLPRRTMRSTGRGGALKLRRELG